MTHHAQLIETVLSVAAIEIAWYFCTLFFGIVRHNFFVSFLIRMLKNLANRHYEQLDEKFFVAIISVGMLETFGFTKSCKTLWRLYARSKNSKRSLS